MQRSPSKPEGSSGTLQARKNDGRLPLGPACQMIRYGSIVRQTLARGDFMHTQETFFRSKEIKRERRALPAATYRLAKIQLSRCGESALFVPIRSMLYMAVVDEEEIIFLDGAVSRSSIELAWQYFRPQQLERLDQPVPYEVAYYTSGAVGIMRQLQGEFHKALDQLSEKTARPPNGDVLPFRKG